MADDPTIEEALRRLEQTKAAFSLVGGNHHVSVRGDDLRTLLASHASLEEWKTEAKRLIREVRVYDNLISHLPDNLYRGLAAFVNEKET